MLDLEITPDSDVPEDVVKHFRTVLRFSLPKDSLFRYHWHRLTCYVFHRSENSEHGYITTYTRYATLHSDALSNSYDHIELLRPSLSAQRTLTIGSYNKKIKTPLV